MTTLPSRRPHLLFLCQTLPYPPDGGVWIRTYHVLRLLAQAFDVTALCFERSRTAVRGGGSPSPKTGVKALSQFGAVEEFALPQNHSRLRFLWDHVRSVTSRRVYTTYLYDSRAFRHRLTGLLATGQFDLVHVDSLDLARYLPDCGDLPIVCVHHDIESALLRRRAAFETNRLKSSYLLHQSRLMQRVERNWCQRVALNVVMSEDDRARLQRLAPGARIVVFPNGVDIDEFKVEGTFGSGVAYVGGTSPAPNLDALQFFCEQILPHLRHPNLKCPVRWVGRASAEQQSRFREQYGVELTGYVDDVRPFMREAACQIVPLRVGGGTRLKILNAWAMGKPVVSTSVGCEGLQAVDGSNILIRDDPAAFAKAIRDVLSDIPLRCRLGKSGRETTERLYGWDVIGQQMIETYFSLRDESWQPLRA